MKLNYVRRFSAYVSTFYNSEYITMPVKRYKFICTVKNGLIVSQEEPLTFCVLFQV